MLLVPFTDEELVFVALETDEALVEFVTNVPLVVFEDVELLFVGLAP